MRQVDEPWTLEIDLGPFEARFPEDDQVTAIPQQRCRQMKSRILGKPVLGKSRLRHRVPLKAADIR